MSDATQPGFTIETVAQFNRLLNHDGEHAWTYRLMWPKAPTYSAPSIPATQRAE